MSQETADERRNRRRRFSRSLVPGALVLVLVGALLATLGGGSLKLLGFLVLAQGVGLIVAMIPLALGRNPISKD
jgi:hypothetical protein